MLWLWILGILLVLLLLLCLTRVGVRAAIEESLTLDVTFGWFHFRLLPIKERPHKAKKVRKKKEPKLEEGAGKKEKKSLPIPGLKDIQDAVKTLWPPLMRALGRVGQGVRLDPLRLWLTVGGQRDPASAAELYGYLNGGVWAAMPQLERLMDIPNPYIHLDIDFTSPENRIQGEAGITFRVGTIFRMAFSVGIPVLRWFLRFIKRKKRQMKKEAAQRPAKETPAA